MADARTPEMQTSQRWTVLSLLQWATEYLAARGFDEARLHVELLLSRVLELPRIGLYTHFDRPLSPVELSSFKSLFRRRLGHEPLQYILGDTEFMGLTFEVNPSVLIPRPETELLVEQALSVLRSGGPGQSVLDVGTGSGNIAVALAVMSPDSRITAMDVSADALAVAARNASRHAATVRFVEGDLFGSFLPGERFDLLVSNPPYVPEAEFVQLPEEIRNFEPRRATTDEGDGFRFIRRLAESAGERLTPGGMLIMEIGYGQSEQTLAILSGAGLASVDVLPDHAHIPRVALGRRP